LDSGPARDLTQSGFITVANVLAAGLAMLFFAVLTNLIVMQYALGVATAALDEGARQGARSLDSVGACLARVRSALGSIEGGAIASGLTVDCRVDGTWVVAEMAGTLDGWAVPVPDISFTRQARAPLEDLP
jgi:hypothetical protein